MDGIIDTRTVFVMEEDENMTDYGVNTTFCPGNECICVENDLHVFHAVFQPVLYSLIFLLGVVGNGLMMTVLLRRRALLRITEIYLLHLALADLLLLLTFPFHLTEIITGWVFGRFLCKLVGLLRNLNLLCGSFLLACIGFDRYLAIVHAIPSMQSRRPRTVHLTCMFLWLVCVGFSVPNLVFLSVSKVPINGSKLHCFYDVYGIHANNWAITDRVLTHAGFFLPLAVISYCYASVAATLSHGQKSQDKQAAIRLALLVTVVFCLCWLPYNIASLISTLHNLQVISFKSCNAINQLQPAVEMTECLGLFHCCLNPFLYAFVGVRFRNELIQLLYKWGCGRVCLPFIKARSYARSSSSEGATTTSGIFI
ncbi:hypothetical protein LDENG_00051130 [Lucifuga dentata]|nr:hypothetical protein LDENG_00051130 [Lucifuga dentata]